MGYSLVNKSGPCMNVCKDKVKREKLAARVPLPLLEDMSVPGTLRQQSFLALDSCVQKCTFELQDEQLLAKLSAGGMVALDAKDHLQCLVSLYYNAMHDEGKDRTDQVI